MRLCVLSQLAVLDGFSDIGSVEEVEVELHQGVVQSLFLC